MVMALRRWIQLGSSAGAGEIVDMVDMRRRRRPKADVFDEKIINENL